MTARANRVEHKRHLSYVLKASDQGIIDHILFMKFEEIGPLPQGNFMVINIASCKLTKQKLVVLS